MQEHKTVSIIGATFSGNKGASAMLKTAIDFLNGNYKSIDINVFSYYPKEDHVLNVHENVKIFSSTPFRLLFVLCPLSLLLRLFKWSKAISGLLLCNNALAAVNKTDLWIDMAGVSFMDGREIYLPFNILCLLPAILLKKKTLKYSQAMGAFRGFLNRILAKIFLPKLSAIVARGKTTYSYLCDLGLKNVFLGADATFSMPFSDFGMAFSNEGTEIVGISPSTVIRRKNDHYVRIMVDFAKYLISEKNKKIILIPHSFRGSLRKKKNNDVFICDEINKAVSHDRCIFLNKDLSPEELRDIIGSLKYHVTSRFHAMISSLERGVPTIVIGWSHKYKEVMEMFTVSEFCIDYKILTLDILKKMFDDLDGRRDSVLTSLKINLPIVKKSSKVNFDLIKSLLVP